MERTHGESAKRALLRAGVFDPTLKPLVTGEDVLFAVTDLDRAIAAVPTARAADAAPVRPHVPLKDREPLARVRAALAAAGWTPADLDALPRRWEKVGDVVLLKVPPALKAREGEMGRAFARALSARSVLADEGGVAGEFREMAATRFLHGTDARTVHVENGVRFAFDAARIMFSSGNVEERRRAAALPAAGETVVDLFAGIGYFTLPLAVHARPARVVACEKNPVAHAHLVENARLNGVQDLVEPRLGDNREVAPAAVADRVLMGYVGGTATFLPVAFRALKPAGGVIHLHDTAHERAWRAELDRALRDAAAGAGRAVEILDARVAKSYSPGVVHAVLDVRVGPEAAP